VPLKGLRPKSRKVRQKRTTKNINHKNPQRDHSKKFMPRKAKRRGRAVFSIRYWRKS